MKKFPKIQEKWIVYFIEFLFGKVHEEIINFNF